MPIQKQRRLKEKKDQHKKINLDNGWREKAEKLT